MTQPGAHPKGGLLVLQPAFLGDVVLSTALLESWHRAHPGLPIRICVRRGAQGFFEGHPFVSDVGVWDRKGWRKYPRMLSLAARAREWKPDVVVNLHRHPSMAVAARIIGGPDVRAFEGTAGLGRSVHRFPHSIGDGRHETERNHALLAGQLGAFDPESDRPRLHPADADRVRAAEWPEGAVVLAPSSVWATKRWPEAHWVQLTDAIHNHGLDVILMGGPGDASLLQRIAEGAARRPRVNAGDTPLLASAAIMATARAVVSNDSAPLHMAGAVGTPAVAVFCSTSPDLGFGVLPGDLVSGRGKNVELPSAALTCRPCGVHGKKACPLGHFRCGRELGVDAVFEALQQVSSLRAAGPRP